MPSGNTGSSDSAGKVIPQFNGNGSGTSSSALTSLTCHPDEGVIVWNGRTYSSVADWMADVKTNPNLTPAQAEILRAKYRAQTGKSLSDYGY